MFCAHCGASNKDDAKFCLNCGESLDEAQKDRINLPVWILKVFSFFKKFGVLKGFFNVSFTQFVASKMVKFLYGLSILSGGLVAALLVIVGFSISKRFGILALLIGAPLVFLLTVIYSRVFLEMVITISRIAGQSVSSAERSESKENIQWNIE